MSIERTLNGPFTRPWRAEEFPNCFVGVLHITAGEPDIGWVDGELPDPRSAVLELIDKRAVPVGDVAIMVPIDSMLQSKANVYIGELVGFDAFPDAILSTGYRRFRVTHYQDSANRDKQFGKADGSATFTLFEIVFVKVDTVVTHRVM
jgi:hypothetical protein